MPPGTLEPHNVPDNLVDQQPIRLDVRIPKSTPAAFQRVVEIGRWQRLSLNEQAQQGLELVHVLAALLRLFHVALELPGVVGLADQIPS